MPSHEPHHWLDFLESSLGCKSRYTSASTIGFPFGRESRLLPHFACMLNSFNEKVFNSLRRFYRKSLGTTHAFLP